MAYARKTRTFVCRNCGQQFESNGSRAYYCANCKKTADAIRHRQYRKKVNEWAFEAGLRLEKTTEDKSEHYAGAKLAATAPLRGNKYRGVKRYKDKYFGVVRIRENGEIKTYSTPRFDSEEQAAEEYRTLKNFIAGGRIEEYLLLKNAMTARRNAKTRKNNH